MGIGQDLTGKAWEQHNEEFRIHICRWDMFFKTTCVVVVEALEKKIKALGAWRSYTCSN